MISLTVRLLSLYLLLIAWLPASHVQGCAVPVFRYALERWENDPFPLVVFHRGTLDASLSQQLSNLEPVVTEKAGPRVNWKVVRVNVDEPVPALWQKLWKAESDKALPRAVLCTPEWQKGEPALWSGPLNQETIESLTTSPKRSELVAHLLKGTAVIWVVVETKDQAKNDALRTRLDGLSKRLVNEILLPAGLGRDGVEVHSHLPLEVSFAMVRVNQDDPAEQVLMHLLNNGEKATEPMLFPVFGRARALASMPASTVNDGLIEETARFICGACSCQVKSQNPGFDLLVKADWESIFGEQSAPIPETRAAPPTKPVYVPIPQRKKQAD